MTHRALPTSFVFCLAALCALAHQVGVAAGANPNIIYIMADDLGIGDLGYAGQNARAAAGMPAISTPNIDALAAQGVSFANMYGSNVCSASRATLLTGFNQAHVVPKEATFSMFLRPGEQDKTWGQVLKGAGYNTGMFGKWHVGGASATSIINYDSLPTQKGFDTVFGLLSGGYRTQKSWEDDGLGGVKQVTNVPDPSWPGPGVSYQFSDDAYADHAAQYIRDHAGQAQPFAAYVAFYAPHDGYDEIPINPLYAGTGWTDSHKGYASLVTRLDQNVGKVLQAIDDPNGDGNTSDSVADNTIVVFTSDNGPRWTSTAANPGGGAYYDTYNNEFFNSNSIYADYKSSTRDGGIRVPFLVRWTGVTTPGAVRSDFVGGFEDILPTFADLVGQEVPLGVDGKSLLPAITGVGELERNDVMSWSYPINVGPYVSNGWGVRVGDWKLNYRQTGGAYSLYNLATDPSEATNLAATRADIKSALQQVAFMQGLGRSPVIPHSTVPSFAVTVIDFFTQFKTWSPASGSVDFTAASNWSGGTSTAGLQAGVAAAQPAQFWNTGPAENWLATVANSTGGNMTATVGANSKVLAMEVLATQGAMNVALGSGVTLEAFNGIRIGAGGAVRLAGSTLKISQTLDVRAGGLLAGSGTVTGWQELVANIPEFDGERFFAPEVVNSGDIDVQNVSAAGLLTVVGDYSQRTSGALHVDVFGGGGQAGADFDKLAVTGAASLSGAVVVDLIGAFTPTVGQSFAVVTAASLVAPEAFLAGPDAIRFTMSLVSGTTLALNYVSADFDANGLVNAADLTLLNSGLGMSGGGLTSLGDADGNGHVDGADYMIWQRQFGYAFDGGGTTLIPEPASIMLLALALVSCFTRFDSRRLRAS